MGHHADLKTATVVSFLLAMTQIKLQYIASVTPLYENLPKPKAT